MLNITITIFMEYPMTEVIFVDTFAWVAIINKSDNYHKICLKTLDIKKSFTFNRYFEQASYSLVLK